MNTETKVSKRIETSKKILLASYFCAVTLTIAVIITTFLQVDNSNLTIVAGTVWGEVAVHTVAYSNKAKAENRLKLVQALVQALSKLKKFDPEILVQILESIIKE